MISDSELLADTVDFGLLGSNLGNDVESALKSTLVDGVIFHNGTNPLVIFRKALAESIRNIESHPRGKLFQEFLLKGPYEDAGETPKEMIDQRLSDTECASAITFIYSFMVNCFKGAVTELLAVKSCSHLLKQLQRKGELPANSQLYIGDIVGVHRASGKGLLKGADSYILIREHSQETDSFITVAGVTEVKSYICSRSRLDKQLDQHIQRGKRGLFGDGLEYPAEKVNVGFGKG